MPRAVLDTSEKPLITFAIIAYNQERYIREAVAGALAQTYSPLEIILSDDCSSDATFEIISSMAATYTGPHLIRLNRNETNAGIGVHVTRVFELARGELVLLTGGDDISLAQRVEATYEAWEASAKRADCVYSGYSMIDAAGRPLDNTGMEFPGRTDGTVTERKYSVLEFLGPNKPIVAGCAAAWNPRLIEIFGSLSAEVVHEDEVLGLRTSCLGSFCCIESSLVKYRLHEGNVFGAVHKIAISIEDIARGERRDWREVETRHGMYGAFMVDLETALKKSLIPHSDFETASRFCRNQQRLLQSQLDFRLSSFFRKCRLLVDLKRQGLPTRDLRFFFPRLLPEPLLLKLKFWLRSIRFRRSE